MADTLRSQMIRLAASFPKGSDERHALLDVLAGDDPFDSRNPRIRKLYEQVEAFLYPEWYKGSGGRGDITPKESLLMDFYQGSLGEEDWASIPKLLADTRRRTDREYEKAKRRVLGAMRASLVGFVNTKELRRLGHGYTLERMEHEGLIRHTYYQGGGYELV